MVAAAFAAGTFTTGAFAFAFALGMVAAAFAAGTFTAGTFALLGVLLMPGQ